MNVFRIWITKEMKFVFQIEPVDPLSIPGTPYVYQSPASSDPWGHSQESALSFTVCGHKHNKGLLGQHSVM